MTVSVQADSYGGHRFKLNSAAAAAAKSLQSCPTLCDPIDGSDLAAAAAAEFSLNLCPP